MRELLPWSEYFRKPWHQLIDISSEAERVLLISFWEIAEVNGHFAWATESETILPLKAITDLSLS